MKITCVIAVLALLVAAPLSLWSQEETDGAQLFKTKCSSCHGDNGEGKPAVKIPAVKGTKMSVDKLVEYLTKGEEGKRIHSNPISGLSAEQAKTIAEYVKTLK
jgi:cytochrome c553